ncbi:MAG: double-strand break repair protein AddB, partial [Pseudolabrys sp.]
AWLTSRAMARNDVKALVEAAPPGRELLVSEALRPAATTERWQARRADKAFDGAASNALATLSLIEAANPEEEALAIAVALREAIETAGKHAALVTPDRALARRVVAALARWNVAVDDSGGDSLADTPAGVFARLAAEAALKGLEPVTLLALLKHPLLRLGKPAGAHANAIATLERALLRGPRPRPGSLALAQALATFRENRAAMHRSDPRHLITADELDAAGDLIARLSAALAPLETLKSGDYPLLYLETWHREVVALLNPELEEIALGGVDDSDRGPTGPATGPAAAAFTVNKKDYPDLFQTLIAGRVVRRPEIHDARVRIFGPLEARLQQIDRVVLGGLNEGTWPPETRSDPWLSRPMRRDLGLDPPERRIGLSAHDFAQALGAPEVILSRAAKLAGAPTVTSRFVQRIGALAGEPRWKQVQARGTRYVELARTLDHPAQVKAAERPAPTPPIAARPARLSVTAIEDLLRDPYTIYARYVLRLAVLDAVDTPPGARDRGTIIHGAIGDYTKLFAAAQPADPVAELRKLGDKNFAPLADFPEARAFWMPRFLRIAQWFAGWDAERRAGIKMLHAEIKGELKFPMGKREFTLSAVADRIEQRSDGSYAIIDYKTGAARTEKEVRTGMAPQLTLEAAILRAGGFKTIAPGPVSELNYVTLKGGEPAGKPNEITFKDGSAPDAHADYSLARLKELAAKFEDATTPYLSLVHPKWKTHYGDYDHLARVKEWSLSGGGDEGEG